MVADFRAGAQVLAGFPLPPPFPPPPFNTALLDAARGAFGAVANALAQIWGLFNSDQGDQQTTGPDPRPPGLPETAYGGTLYEPPPGQRLKVYDPSGFGKILIFATPVSFWYEPDGASGPAFLWAATSGGSFKWRPANFQPFQIESGAPPSSFVLTYVDAVGDPTTANPVEAFVPQPMWEPEPTTLPDFPEPEPQPEPLPEPERPRPIVPVIAPPVPGSVPVAPPGRAPSTPSSEPQAPPAVAPRTPAYPQPTPTQQPTPTGQETAPSGELVPLPLPLPTPTSPTAHVINGTQVPANGPAPTLTGIAQELGRLERKSAQMLDPSRAPTGPKRDRLGLAEDLLGLVVQAIIEQFNAGSYEISSPCELTEAGERVPVVVPYAAGFNSIHTLHNKVDALAEVLQAHKDLKQPICKQTPAIGEPVTVNFEQVN
jgi:hypothetical protein